MSPRMKFTFAVIAVLWILAVVYGGFQHDKPHSNDLDIGTIVGLFRHLRLQIDEKTDLPNGHTRYSLSGSYHGQKTGVNLELEPFSQSNSPNAISRPRAYFSRTGPESDLWVAMMNDYYQTGLPAKPMLGKVAFEMKKDPEEDPALTPGHLKLELVRNAKEPFRFAKFGVELDFASKRFFILEEDKTFRPAIVRAFQGN